MPRHTHSCYNHAKIDPLERLPMHLVISHASALRFWRTFNADISTLQRPRAPRPMDKPASLTPELLAELAELGFVPSPQKRLDLLFGTEGVRTRAKTICAHATARELPAGSLVKVSKHVLVASPELAFVQMSTRFSLGQLIMAGAEMSGTYALLAPDGSPLALPRTRKPLTSGARILECIASLDYDSASPAARAATRIPDNAASPMEAKVALLLSLPHAAGGYGLPAPLLNAPVALSEAAAALYPHANCRCDLFWPDAKLDLEYDGQEAHENRLTEDAARRAALAIEGVDVIGVSKAQVYDSDAFASIAQLLNKKLGAPIRNRMEPQRFAESVAALRRDLNLE